MRSNRSKKGSIRKRRKNGSSHLGGKKKKKDKSKGWKDQKTKNKTKKKPKTTTKNKNKKKKQKKNEPEGIDEEERGQEIYNDKEEKEIWSDQGGGRGGREGEGRGGRGKRGAGERGSLFLGNCDRFGENDICCSCFFGVVW